MFHLHTITMIEPGKLLIPHNRKESLNSTSLNYLFKYSVQTPRPSDWIILPISKCANDYLLSILWWGLLWVNCHRLISSFSIIFCWTNFCLSGFRSVCPTRNWLCSTRFISVWWHYGISGLLEVPVVEL